MTLQRFIKLVLLVSLTTVAGASLVSCKRSNGQPSSSGAANPPPAILEVSTAPAVVRQLPRFFEATGTLAADVQTDVQPQTAGKVVAVGVDMGSAVSKGQMLVRLEDADYKLRVDQAVAQLDSAKAAVSQAEEKLGLQPGQKFDPERVADVSVARANYNLAESNFQRAQKLIESGDISRAEFDQRKSQLDALKQAYESSIAQARQKDRKSTRLNSIHTVISYAVFCLKKKKKKKKQKKNKKKKKKKLKKKNKNIMATHKTKRETIGALAKHDV